MNLPKLLRPQVSKFRVISSLYQAAPSTVPSTGGDGRCRVIQPEPSSPTRRPSGAVAASPRAEGGGAPALRLPADKGLRAFPTQPLCDQPPASVVQKGHASTDPAAAQTAPRNTGRAPRQGGEPAGQELSALHPRGGKGTIDRAENRPAPRLPASLATHTQRFPATRGRCCKEEGRRDGGKAKRRSHYQSFVPVLAEGASENSLDVAKVPVAEVRGADDNVVALHGAGDGARAASPPPPGRSGRPGLGGEGRGWRGPATCAAPPAGCGRGGCSPSGSARRWLPGEERRHGRGGAV